MFVWKYGPHFFNPFLKSVPLDEALMNDFHLDIWKWGLVNGNQGVDGGRFTVIMVNEIKCFISSCFFCFCFSFQKVTFSYTIQNLDKITSFSIKKNVLNYQIINFFYTLQVRSSNSTHYIYYK